MKTDMNNLSYMILLPFFLFVSLLIVTESLCVLSVAFMLRRVTLRQYLCVLSIPPSLHPSCQCFIDLDGPVGMVQTADRDIQKSQPLVRACTLSTSTWQQLPCPSTRGRVVAALTTSWWEEEGFFFFFAGMLSQCIIVHRANRLPVTLSGWGLLWQTWVLLVWLPGGASWLDYRSAAWNV